MIYNNVLLIIDCNIRWDLKKWRNRHKKIASKLNQLFCGMSKQTEDDIKDKKPEDAKCFEVYLFSFSPLYRLLFVVCSILSLASHGYFYCGCILYLFLKSSVLHQVLTAVRRSGMCCYMHVYVCMQGLYFFCCSSAIDCRWFTGFSCVVDICRNIICHSLQLL